MTTLLHLPYSPWSEKARWALDYQRVPYRARDYLPMLGEPLLRAKLKRWVGRVSVPILFTNDAVIEDSFEIARFADRHGARAPLITAAREAEILLWIHKTERMMGVGRSRALLRSLQHPEALREFVPPALSHFGLVTEKVAELGVRFVRQKYADTAPDSGISEIRHTLEDARAALAQHGRYLTGEFTFADVALCAALQFISPVSDQFFPIGKHSRETLTEVHLAREFADVLAYRDRVYSEYRSAG